MRSSSNVHSYGRRKFLRHGSAMGAAGILGLHHRSVLAEPPPETTTLRSIDDGSICIAPALVAEALLKAEGFTDVRYVKFPDGAITRHLGAGDADVAMTFAPSIAYRLDAGDPVLVLAGVHLGCYELFGNESVRAIRDLKGKTVAVHGLEAPGYVFLSSMAAYVGLDPRKDIRWETHPPAESARLFAEGKVDAYLAFPPFAQQLRAKRVGHVVVNTSTDRPWSQYFCCMLAGNRDFVRKHPIATKRAMRAIFKATDLCAQDPERAARFLADKGYVPSLDYAMQSLKEVPYNAWRTYDPENTLRFFALRLHEVGMIKSDPNRIIAQSTDWRFLNELKKEMKA